MGVGIMLCWLGYDVLRRLIRERIHFHTHRHDGHDGHNGHDELNEINQSSNGVLKIELEMMPVAAEFACFTGRSIPTKAQVTVECRHR